MPITDTTIPDSVDSTLPPSAALVPRKTWLLRFGKRMQPITNRWIARSSRVGNKTVYDEADKAQYFPWVAELEAHWHEIRDEAAVVLQDLEAVPPIATISPDHRRIAPAGRWRSYFLIGYRYRDPDACAACPRTAALVSKIPGVNSAFFSILVPGARIPPHTGVTKAFLTCHLGIQVPRDADNCRMRVVDQWVGWQDGRVLVFDDTFNHEVRNDTDETRIVLLIQVRRPVGLVGGLIGWMFVEGVRRSRFVQEARRGMAAWQASRIA